MGVIWYGVALGLPIALELAAVALNVALGATSPDFEQLPVLSGHRAGAARPLDRRAGLRRRDRLNILVSVVQEVRAKRTLDRIALLTRPTASVIRDGAARRYDPTSWSWATCCDCARAIRSWSTGMLIGDGRMTWTSRC